MGNEIFGKAKVIEDHVKDGVLLLSCRLGTLNYGTDFHDVLAIGVMFHEFFW